MVAFSSAQTPTLRRVTYIGRSEDAATSSDFCAAEKRNASYTAPEIGATPKICIMKLPDSDTAYFFELETSLHKRQVRNSTESTSALLSDAFIEFGSSGRVWNKDSIIESMRREEVDPQITVENFAARELATDVVLVTYISKKDVGSTLRSSIWKRCEGKWQMIFHQGTRSTESAC
jgi:hypothetical protein